MNLQQQREIGALVDQFENDCIILTNAATLKPEPIEWLWHSWLARGKLHILAGAPGQGKTTIALSFAATISSGGRWPDKSQSNKGRVLIWSGEDDAADTLLPRLMASGADISNIYFIKGSRKHGKIEPFDPSTDMDKLREEAEQIGDVKLLIVDPIVSAVTGDSHKNTEVRRALQPLVDLGQSLNAAVLGISHFSKGGQGNDPAQRVVGSIAFTAVARVVLVAAKVKSEDGEERKVLARGKSNIGPDDGGFEFDLAQAEPIKGINASYVIWRNPVEGSARKLLSETDESDPDSVGTDAKNFLIEILADGVTPVAEIEKQAENAGVSWSAVKRASSKLGVKKQKGGYQGAWYWSLPKGLKEIKGDQPLSK
jgi:putative DNA primase/helicase